MNVYELHKKLNKILHYEKNTVILPTVRMESSRSAPLYTCTCCDIIYNPPNVPCTLKTPGSNLTQKRVRGGQTHFGVRPTRNPGQTDQESESERHFGLRLRSFLPGFQISLTQEWVWPHGTLFRVKSDPGVF